MKRRKLDLAATPGKAAVGVDDRFQVATPLRKLLNKQSMAPEDVVTDSVAMGLPLMNSA